MSIMQQEQPQHALAELAATKPSDTTANMTIKNLYISVTSACKEDRNRPAYNRPEPT